MKYELQKVQDPKHPCRSIYKLVEITDGYDLIQLKRGVEEELPLLELKPGEPAFVMDTGKLFIGDESGNPRLINPDPEELATQVIFKTRHEFPVIGASDKLYVATDENSIYRYDVASRTYKCVGSDFRMLDLIDGGTSLWQTD